MAKKKIVNSKYYINLINGECLSVMKDIPESSVDLILTDLPYGVTQNKWDTIIPFDDMWELFNNVIKPNGAIVLTASEPFASALVMSNPQQFKYDMIWLKTVGSGQLNAKRQPLRIHENILVFYDKQPTYNPQYTEGEPYKINRKANKFEDGNYGKQKQHTAVNTGTRTPKSAIEITNPRIKGGHPTQKPVELMSYLIKTFSNKDDIVLDCCMGSGTTGISCINEQRRFIGIELDENYFDEASDRIFEKTPLLSITTDYSSKKIFRKNKPKVK